MPHSRLSLKYSARAKRPRGRNVYGTTYGPEAGDGRAAVRENRTDSSPLRTRARTASKRIKTNPSFLTGRGELARAASDLSEWSLHRSFSRFRQERADKVRNGTDENKKIKYTRVYIYEISPSFGRGRARRE